MPITAIVKNHSERLQFQALFPLVIEYEATYDPPSILSNGQDIETIAIPGARFGDFVLVSIDQDTQFLGLTGYVSAADEVSILLVNNAAGTIDLPSCNLHIVVLRPLHGHPL